MLNPPAPQPSARPDSDATLQEAAVATWLAVHSALVPIIGQGGFIALHKRCIHLAMADHPWLAASAQGTEGPGDFQTMLQALQQQSPAEAAAAHTRLLQSLQAVLSNLIGASLVQRLLGAVLVIPSIGQPEQGSLS
jgi:hypothetical protein